MTYHIANLVGKKILRKKINAEKTKKKKRQKSSMKAIMKVHIPHPLNLESWKFIVWGFQNTLCA